MVIENWSFRLWRKTMDYKQIVDSCEKENIKLVDLRFCDLPGSWQHFAVPVGQFKEKIFADGIGFDGSSIRGFKNIEESDMILIPDAKTFAVDRFGKEPAGSLICDVYDPESKTRFEKDPRAIAQAAEKFLRESGIADMACFGPEAEFFIFDRVEFANGQNHSFFRVQSSEAGWDDNGEDAGSAKIRNKEGYSHGARRSNNGYPREMGREMQKLAWKRKKSITKSPAGQAK